MAHPSLMDNTELVRVQESVIKVQMISVPSQPLT